MNQQELVAQVPAIPPIQEEVEEEEEDMGRNPTAAVEEEEEGGVEAQDVRPMGPDDPQLPEEELSIAQIVQRLTIQVKSAVLKFVVYFDQQRGAPQKSKKVFIDRVRLNHQTLKTL